MVRVPPDAVTATADNGEQRQRRITATADRMDRITADGQDDGNGNGRQDGRDDGEQRQRRITATADRMDRMDRITADGQDDGNGNGRQDGQDDGNGNGGQRRTGWTG
jgi:hypothetical protein